MKNTNLKTIEQALSMYKETVSPSHKSLQVVLSQIPEQKNREKMLAVRSPYRWLALTQVAMALSIVFVMVTTITPPAYQSNPFYKIDKQVDEFEATITQEDYEKSSQDYTLLSTNN